MQNEEGLTFAKVGKMRVAIDQAGEHRHLREIDHCRACGNRQIFANRFNFAATYQDHLVRLHAARLHVNELAGANYRNLCCGWRLLRRSICGKEGQKDDKTEDLLTHGCPFACAACKPYLHEFFQIAPAHHTAADTAREENSRKLQDMKLHACYSICRKTYCRIPP